MLRKFKSRIAVLAAIAAAALVLIYLTFGWKGILVAAIAAYVIATMAIGYWFAATVFASAVIVGAPIAALFGIGKEYLNSIYSWRSYARIALTTVTAPVTAPFALFYFVVETLKGKEENARS